MITSGAVHAFYLFDVAQGIDLARLRASFGPTATTATLQDKTAGPPRLRYIQPPVVIDGELLELTKYEGFRARVKFYDYGVISIMLSRPFSGSWPAFVQLGQDLIESEPLESHASAACRRVMDRVGGALVQVRPTVFDEDYLAFVVSGLDEPADAESVLASHGDDIAQLLRGERQQLSRQERDEVLRHRLSYLTDDLVVPAWNAAFVLDNEPAAQSALELLEFANSQLLEFRYHDELLEAELTHTYAVLEKPRWIHRMVGRRYTRATRRLQSVFIEVNELTDRSENAVKFVPDVYSARLFTLAAARLGLDAWKRNVEEKLKTLNDIYRFAVEETGTSRANFLELVIVLILVLELGMLLAGIMK